MTDSSYPELGGKRKLDVRPWNVREGDIIEFYGLVLGDSSLMLVTERPTKSRFRYRVAVREIRRIGNGHSPRNPDHTAWYSNDTVEVYRD